MPHDLPDRLLLASASPRRREMLERCGVAVECMPSDLDDASLPPRGAAALPWAASMAWFKAARVAWLLRRAGPVAGPVAGSVAEDVVARRGSVLILAADTVCDLDGAILGKPSDAQSCRTMLAGFVGRSHRVHTGVCLLELDGDWRSRRRWIVTDSAVVHLGHLSGAAIDLYVESGAWAGKAGGYNYAERVDAGWPLRCDGDPTTVMGLPMRRLPGWLASFGDARGTSGADGGPAPAGDASSCGEVACGCR